MGKKIDWDAPIIWSDGVEAEILRKNRYGVNKVEYQVTRGTRIDWLGNVVANPFWVGKGGCQYGDYQEKRLPHIVNGSVDPTLRDIGLES